MIPAPPHDLAAEHALIGCCIVRPHLVDEVDTKPAEFYEPRSERVWAAVLALRAQGKAIDAITVTSEASKRGNRAADDGIDEHVGNVTQRAFAASTANIREYAATVRSYARRRALIDECKRIVADAHDTKRSVDELADDAESRIQKCSDIRQAREPVSAAECMREVFQGIDRAAAAGTVVTGLATGIERLDALTTGLHPGELIIVAGRPGMGKSAFASGIATNTSISGKTAAVFSLEMPKDGWSQRQLASEARVDLRRIRAGRIDRGEQQRMVDAGGVIGQAPHFIDDTPAITLAELRSKCRRIKTRQGLHLVVVDYLQLMRGTRTDHREQEIAEISRGLKALAKDLEVPIVALSQLNRGLESRADKRPMMSDLRESGAIEQDADLILFIYRDEVYDKATSDRGIAEIIVGKQRNGPIGVVRTRFFGEYTRFDNLVDDAWNEGTSDEHDSGERYNVGSYGRAS